MYAMFQNYRLRHSLLKYLTRNKALIASLQGQQWHTARAPSYHVEEYYKRWQWCAIVQPLLLQTKSVQDGRNEMTMSFKLSLGSLISFHK